MNPLPWWLPYALAIVLMAAGAGIAWHLRGEVDLGKSDQAKLEQKTVDNQHLGAILKWELGYEDQLNAAAAADARNSGDIDTAAHLPVPGLVCKRSPGAQQLRPLADAKAPGAGGSGGTDQLPGSDFDPGPRLRKLALKYARALEACYAWADTVPQVAPP